jgi:hypothetical protein
MRCKQLHIGLQGLMMALMLLPHALVGWHVATAHHHTTCCQSNTTDGLTVQTPEDDCPICNFQFIRDLEKPQEVDGVCKNDTVVFIGPISYKKCIATQSDINEARGPPTCKILRDEQTKSPKG